LRLYQPQDELNGNRGIDGRTACSQDLKPGLDRIGIGGRDHEMISGTERLVGPAGGRLGWTRQPLGGRASRQQGNDEEQR
jgi:hypothetical protein